MGQQESKFNSVNDSLDLLDDDHDEQSSTKESSQKKDRDLVGLEENINRLLVYAEGADSKLQKEIAEKLANEAVNSGRQRKIVELGGLRLLLPLSTSSNKEVQRLAAHALANLSVDTDNQKQMAKEGVIELLLRLVDNEKLLVETRRQSCKALANLAVHEHNKTKIAFIGGIKKLIELASKEDVLIGTEAIAALANLAVNDENEIKIADEGGLQSILRIIETASTKQHSSNLKLDKSTVELMVQSIRAIRNLSYNHRNRKYILDNKGDRLLETYVRYPNERVQRQAQRALNNLNQSTHYETLSETKAAAEEDFDDDSSFHYEEKVDEGEEKIEAGG